MFNRIIMRPEEETYEKFISRMGNTLMYYADNHNMSFQKLMNDIQEHEKSESKKVYIYVLNVAASKDDPKLHKAMRTFGEDYIYLAERGDDILTLVFRTRKAAYKAFMEVAGNGLKVSQTEKVEMPAVE